MNPLLVRIFDVDFYMSTPVQNLDVTFSQFRGSAIHQVPVLRVFGSTDVGKKICLHIHGVFPYFYIPYDGSEPANGLMYKIASNLDKAINISMGQTSSTHQHIYKIVLVSGIPFYGYHSKKHQFFKVYLYNPMLIKRVNNLLFNESVLGKIYQPHETHLNFTLQFMIDYNLHGMSNIIMSQVKFRQRACERNEEFVEENLSKVSSCELECDTLGEYILNRQEIESGNLAANPGIAALWEDEKQRRRNKNEDSQLPHYLSLSKTNIPPTDSHELFKRALKERLAILSQDSHKNDFNQSVYPAECPRNKSILNCSNIDYHSPLSSQSDLSYDSEFDQTIMNDTLNLTVDQDVQDLLDVLKDLETNVSIEEDSILSQISKNEFEDLDEDHDMSISIDACDKLLNETINFQQLSEGTETDENLVNMTSERSFSKSKKFPNIPQLDGNCPDFVAQDPQGAIQQVREHNLLVDFELKKSSSNKGNCGRIFHEEKNTPFTHLSDKHFRRKAEGKEDLEDTSSIRIDNSLDFKIHISSNQKPFNYTLEYSPQGCSLQHKYVHVEKLTNMQLHHPKIIEAKRTNKKIIEAIIDKEHTYFSEDTIAKRVSSKNSVKRHKLSLRKIIEYPCELVVLCNNLYLSQKNKRKRDMPSLDIIAASSETCYQTPYIIRWKPIRNFPHNIGGTGKIKNVVMKTVVKKKFSFGRKQLVKKYYKRMLLVEKFCKRYEECWDKLNEGAKPIFKIIPGYRPYTFRPMKIQKVVSIQTLTQSNNCIQFSRALISNELISSNIELQEENEDGSNQTEEEIPEKLQEFSPRNVQITWGGQKMNENTPLNPARIAMSQNRRSKQKKANNIESMKFNQDVQISTNFISKTTSLGAGPPRKSIEEVFKAQKANETLFFESVHSVMDNFTISEIKLLQSSHERKFGTEFEKKDILFLDGAFDDSDEDDPKKSNSRNKRTKPMYSSLPIVTSSKSSGRSTPFAPQNDSKMKNEAELIADPEITENMKKIKKRLNFDSSSLKNTNTDEEHSPLSEITNSIQSETRNAAIDEGNNVVNEFIETDFSNSAINLFVETELVEYRQNEISYIKETYLTNSPAYKCGLSASELYDLMNDYYPQPGCSNYSDVPVQSNTQENDNGGSSTANNDGSGSELDDIWLSTPEEDNSGKNHNELESEYNSNIDGAIQSSGSVSDMFSYEKQVKKEVLPFLNSLPYFKPLYKPPTRSDVMQSLSDYGIPQLRPQEPFYSNAEDASGSMEIGYNLLKIKTLTTMDAQDFESSFEGLDQFRKKFFPHISGQKNKENPRYFYCSEGDCLLTPLKRPPTREEIKNWLHHNSVPKKIEKTKIKKSKIYFVSSQDIYSDNDMSMDLSLTLSPTTPKTDKTLTNTPESNITPIRQETDLESDVSTPTSSKSTRKSPVLKITGHETGEATTPESIINSDISLKEDSSVADVTLTPRSSRSRRGSKVLAKSRRRTTQNNSMTLRKSALLSRSSDHSGVISGTSLNNTYGFQCSVQNYQDARASVKYEYLTILSMEVHVNSRGDFNPNPLYDSIQAIFYCISNDVEENTVKPRKCEGLFAINSEPEGQRRSCAMLDGKGISCDIKYVQNEFELFKEFTNFIIHWDPDILLGYEIQMLSWGYLIERCFHLGINIIPEISRVKDKHLKFNEKETGDLRVSGRVVLDLWRLLRHEIALQSYTIQSTVYEILQRRIPKFSFKELTAWWSHQSSLFRHRTVNYYMTCVRCQLKILEQLDFVGRTSELARLFGIQFYEVLSRGSQFRVESMMLRLAKPMNYVAVSPSVQQRANMRAPEHIALVLEPESKLYTDPLIVLDFQSLYPSIIIAYNYCFSTCAGRVESLGKNTPFEFGASNLRVSKDRIKYLLKKNLLNFSPCGVAFVKKSVRDGIMPRMLREILDTRLMVKKSMKENKEDAVLQKVLHNRQLGLKLIANVTYGYTAANFSGRMPSVELGDSIVSKARETLQRTISLVDNNKEWGVRVVYGDTDSLFVLCPGKSRTEAFAIGEQIVEAVGKENPDPVKLKLEKVYQPCILQTKKRYVGYMYESPEQKEPTYDAKGIETVRRDGCPAVSKMLEKTLRILFETKDISRVKDYCLKQFNKIILGRISIKDLTFAKEFRGLTGYRPGACVPSLELAKKWVALDKRAEPRRGERVPYVIINGPPGLPLIRLVRSPSELLKDPALRPNALYYITRVIIPPLNRCFNLIGVDLHHWFLQMPRKHLQNLPTATSPTKKSTISQYFISTLCVVCGIQTLNGLCDDCREKPQETVTILNERTRQWEASYNNCKLICSSCSQILEDPKCISLDCPVLYRLNQTGRDVQQADHIRHLLSQYFDIV